MAKAKEAVRRRSFHQLVELEMPHLRRAYEGGSKEDLLRALTLCIAWRYPIPEWVRADVYAALNRYRRYEASTLDEAFGVHRSMNPRTIASARKRIELAERVCIYITLQSRIIGRSRNEDFFEEVGEKFGIKKTRVKEYWALYGSEALKKKG